MDQHIFETRQRAQQILQDALMIWRNSPQSDYLLGIENDPMFSLLTMALATQINRIESEIYEVRHAVANEFLSSLVPSSMISATPASTMVSCKPIQGIGTMQIDENSTFRTATGAPVFRPVLRTTLVSAEIHSVQRIDGLRWKVTLTSSTPFTSIAGMAFVINRNDYDEVSVTLNREPLPLITPDASGNLPAVHPLSVSVSTYHDRLGYNAQHLVSEMCSMHGKRLYIVDDMELSDYQNGETTELTLIFTFRNIKDSFSFTATDIILNTVILADYEIHSATLSSSMPVLRVTAENKQNDCVEQFMHLLPPSDEQMFRTVHVGVRRVLADRYHTSKLKYQVHALLDRFYTDFSAFAPLNNDKDINTMRRLSLILNNLMQRLDQKDSAEITGTYLTISTNARNTGEGTRIEAEYVTTHGTGANHYANSQSWTGPHFIETITPLGSVLEGNDEVNDYEEKRKMAAYFFATHDRIVTPSDIRMFCFMQLKRRYELGEFMIEHIKVNHLPVDDRREAPYTIAINIAVHNNRFLPKQFINDIPLIQSQLAAQIRSRSTAVYPVSVTITLKS